MRAAGLVAVFFAILSGSCRGQQDAVQGAIKSALKWRYRWMEPVPRDVASIQCSVALFDDLSFAFCEPVAISMIIETREKRLPRVTYIGHEPSSFEVALANFRKNMNPNGHSLGPVHKVPIAVRDLWGCTIDQKQTNRAPSVILKKEVRAALISNGQTLRYPVICEGDPFYLLYCLADQRISWIWLYEINGDRFDLRWSFDAGTEQRKPPEQAIANLNRKELWYKVEPRTAGGTTF